MYSIGFKTDAAISDLKKNKKFKQVSENEMSLLWFCKNKKIKNRKENILTRVKNEKQLAYYY